MKLKFILFTLLLSAITFGQKATITGVILDKEYDNEPLAFANVMLKGTSIGTSTDEDGKYTLTVSAGNHVLVVGFLGYKTVEIPFSVKANEKKVINYTLETEGVMLEDVVVSVVANKESEQALLQEQQKAVEITQSIGAEELSSKGVGDAAGAVAKISGVSKQEGSANVYVRGLGDRYLNSTMNGLSLPSNDVNKKNIDLNLFSSDVIQNISISKTYSSKFYGDFAAGNIDISSKEYTGKGFFDMAVGSSFNSRAIDKNFIKNEGTGFFGEYSRYDHNPFAVILSHGVDPVDAGTPVNINFGFSAGKSFEFKNDSKLSLFVTGSFENGYEYRQGTLADYAAAEIKSFSEIEEYQYSTTSTAMATAVYKLDKNNKFKYTSLFINSSSDEIGYYGTDGKGILYNYSSDPSGYFQTNYQFNQDIVLVNQLMGDHTYGKFDFDWGIGFNKVIAHEPDRKRFSLFNYDNLLDNDPNTSPNFAQNNNFNNQRYFQNIDDEELNSRLSVTYNKSEKLKLIVGYDGKTRERYFENSRYGYKNINTDIYTITDIRNLNSLFNTQNFIDGLYQTHVFNPINSAVGITQTNFPGELENTYTGKLDIHAGFLSAEINVGEKWLFVPGMRFENIVQRIDYNAINLLPSDQGFSEANETFALPSLSIKYSVKENQNLRFAASKTISFPEFKEIAPFVYEGVNYRIGGNSDLLGSNSDKPNFVNVSDKAYSDVYNVDFKYEWFINRGEVLSIGAFGKQINNPINLVLAADATGTQRYFRTGNKAEILGLEIEFKKDILRNKDEDAMLSTGLNFTYTHTKQDLFSTIQGTYGTLFNRASDELEGASPVIVNANLSFKPTISENFKPTANVVFNYASDKIFSLGSGDVGNVIQKAVPSFDFILKNKVGANTEINFSAKNILDPNIQQIRENTTIGDVVLSSYKKGITIGLQVKYNF